MKLVEPEIEYIKEKLETVLSEVATLRAVSPIESINQRIHSIERLIVECMRACDDGIIQDVN